ncbi:hypothetical protein JVT61DRAFT_251 [Boletus reticuloceps]|uniref:Uncharacterized protein n=1 Tax=Boletus reticuloceps TaxID=495285 RepID=A0A8I2Z3A6_9AGAM|nr:hypothetical protein JVT61DRAFT_251 [Boletus reticuloceps]
MSKSRPVPLRDLQIPVQADQSRHYLILDTHSSVPSPTYPFDPPLQLLDSLSSNPPLVQVEPSVCTFNYSWNDSLDSRLNPARHYRSFTPPISAPALSPCAQDTESSPKRSGRTFASVLAQVNGKHVVVNPKDNDSKRDFPPASVSPRQDGLPEDMQDMLRQLDDLASWVKMASSSSNCNVTPIVHATPLTGHLRTDASGHSAGNPCLALFPNKGKNRLLLTSPPSGCNIHRDLVHSSSSAMPGGPRKISVTDCQSDGFIYVPDCNTPEFLAGSSSSPIAYPVCGYSSHPSRYSPHPLDTTYDPYHRRFLARRSAPCPPPTSPLAAPSSGKTSFKTLFQRSRCNTTAVARPGIPSGHVPVENALRQGKRMRLPWLRI